MRVWCAVKQKRNLGMHTSKRGRWSICNILELSEFIRFQIQNNTKNTNTSPYGIWYLCLFFRTVQQLGDLIHSVGRTRVLKLLLHVHSQYVAVIFQTTFWQPSI